MIPFCKYENFYEGIQRGILLLILVFSNYRRIVKINTIQQCINSLFFPLKRIYLRSGLCHEIFYFFHHIFTATNKRSSLVQLCWFNF